MKRLLALTLLLFAGVAGAQQQQILCNVALNTPCPGGNPNTGQGDTLRTMGGKVNVNFNQLFTAIGPFTGLANPTGLIGMSAVNGVATTTARSDATHAIDPAITPTWTGVHTFSSTVTGTSNGGGLSPSFLAKAAIGTVGWQSPGNAADQKNVQCYWNGAVLQFNCTFLNDTGLAEKSFLNVLRGTTTTVSAITLGNATDVPTISGNGVDMTPATTTATGTVVGCTTTPTTTVRYVRSGNIVVAHVDAFSCTSNSTALTLTGAVPAAFQPVHAQDVAVIMGDNGVSVFCTASVRNASSTLTFFAGASGAFTASGTKGTSNNNIAFTYPLN